MIDTGETDGTDLGDYSESPATPRPTKGEPESIDPAKLEDVPVVPLRGTVMFPKSMQPLVIGRPSTMALAESLQGDDLVVLVAQRDPSIEEPGLDDLYEVGVAARFLKMAKMSDDDGHAVVLTHSLERVRLLRSTASKPFLRAKLARLPDVPPSRADAEFQALLRNVSDLAFRVIKDSPGLSAELLGVLRSIEDPGTMADFVGSFLPSLNTRMRQELLEMTDVAARLGRAYEELLREKESLHVRGRIEAEVQEKVSRGQREFLLREQMSAIRRELGEIDEEGRIVRELRDKIAQSGMPEAVGREASRELLRLEQTPSAAAEYNIIRTYLDWLTTLPWQDDHGAPIDLDRAAAVLDEDHYDLDKIKVRILEYLAVLKLTRSMRGPILCLVGPPGVGKTSLGRSIARALGRPFVRLSLGGMRDEAEIRGHRRTYVGALPGQIIQGLRRAGTRDPVFMLDEVDKLGKDFRGDPAAALLEVLDPEQNHAFRDQYLDVPFDLSKVLFVTTANILDTIPPALRDRMEILDLAGYSEDEKLEIAFRYLIPKLVDEHGLSRAELSFDRVAVRQIIRGYTHESGVRGLERTLAAVCRKHARVVATRGSSQMHVGAAEVRALLGVPRFEVEREVAMRTRAPGVAVALAWTPQGGDVLFVEAVRMARGKGDVTMTGQLGDVMKESVRAALSWVRASASALELGPEPLRALDLHVHVPAGAVPKDGPSAGVVMAIALVSMLAGRPVRPYVAATGEITLRGHVLPVGGIKEKVLAARQSGIREIILPERNRPHLLEDVAEHLRAGITFHFVSTLDEALALALPQVVAAPARAHEPAQVRRSGNGKWLG
jgi:ATP-dependent Lon protease